MNDILEVVVAFLLTVGGWITSVMLAGFVFKLNYYIFMWGWALV